MCIHIIFLIFITFDYDKIIKNKQILFFIIIYSHNIQIK
ncbi:hypothetical protein SALWKB2_0237 [Snodgrassella alvi wkB2]|nr:hypothetical protein SALWKB2_0237 [Snodgrassella alvi wkB2]